MANENKYNGWQNYFTWCINLHLTNDESVYKNIMFFKERLEMDGANGKDLVYELASYIKEYVQDYFIDNADLFIIADILGYALCECNFIEIAEGFCE